MSTGNNAGSNVFPAAITDLQGRMTIAEANISALDSSVNQLNLDVSTLSSSFSALQLSVDSLSGQVVSLSNSVTLIESSVSDLSVRVGNAEAGIANLNTSVTQLNTNVSALTASMNALTITVNQNTSNISTLSSSVSALNTSVTSLSGTVSALSLDLSGVQVEIDGIQQLPVVQLDSRTPSVDLVDFDALNGPAPFLPGRSLFDPVSKSWVYDNDLMRVKLGQQDIIPIRNAGPPITKGQVFYVSGATGGVTDVLLAQANAIAAPGRAYGLAGVDMATGAFGYGVMRGIIEDINTAGLIAGQPVYLSATVAGGLTSAAPASTPPSTVAVAVELGIVLSASATTGKILISVKNSTWGPFLELRETAATVALTTTNTVFKPSTIAFNYGFNYSAATGEIEFLIEGKYDIAGGFNSYSTASNRRIYLYSESSLPGSGVWTFNQFAGRSNEIANGSDTQVPIVSKRPYVAGEKLRFSIYAGNATTQLRTTSLPAPLPANAVVVPAFRAQIG